MFEKVMCDVGETGAGELEELVRKLQALALEALEVARSRAGRLSALQVGALPRKGFDKVWSGGRVFEETQRYLCT